MNQTAKTLIFVGVAAASVAVAAGTYYSNRPADIADFSDVGDKFYPKFEDPAQATALRVAAYNESTGKTEVFKVENKEGLWQIPSHHNYPADGKDRLGKTAASMIGVVRQALVERSKTAQRRFEVLDPLDTDVSGTEGRGDRITLYKGDDILVDFIVGKKVENSSNLYYVRRADEERIYTADLGNLQVSTKFADWIEKDILQVQSADVRELLISRYYVDEAQGKVVQEGQIELKRGTGNDPWNLKDLKPETEKLKLAEVNSLLTSLEELKIVGVRRKPEALIAGLKSEEGKISIDPFIARDLQQKGVFISKGGEFIYNEGKVNVGTDQGVLYELGFGEEFSGSDLDIEIGGEKSAAAEAKTLEKETADEKSPADKADKKESDEKSPQANKKKQDSSATDDKKDDNEDAKPGEKKSRYLFVTVYFDKSLLGPAPAAPTAPEKPKPAVDQKAGDKKETAAKDAGKTPEEKKTDEKTDSADADKKSDANKSDPQKAYEDALKEYELQKEVYEAKKKDYAEKIKAGEKRVAELNARFADWYYVISEDVFDKLKLKREALVEPATPEKNDAAADADQKPEAGMKPGAEKTSTDKTEAPKSDDGKPMETPAPKAAAPSASATGDKPGAADKPAQTEKPAGKPEEKADAPPSASKQSKADQEKAPPPAESKPSEKPANSVETPEKNPSDSEEKPESK